MSESRNTAEPAVCAGIERLSLIRVLLTGAIGAVSVAASMAAVPETLYLTNDWRLERAPDVVQNGGQLSQVSFNDSTWVPAVVPGTVLTSYERAGLIPDPYFGNNMQNLSQSHYNVDYWYRDEFVVPSGYAGRTVWLNFDGINWKADIYLNGSYVGRINGPFIRGKFNVTSNVTAGGTNALAVRIHMMANPSNNSWHDVPYIMGSESWDFMPAIPGRNVGLYENVFLSTSGPVSLVDPHIVTDLPLPATSPAAVSIEVGLTNSTGSPVSGSLEGSIEPGGIHFTQAVAVAAGGAVQATFNPGSHAQLSVANPALWWPNGYGEQNLHTLTLTFRESGTVSDRQDVTFGYREYGYDTSGHELYLEVNGERVMCKGGNWGMPDAMLKYSPMDMDAAVRMHKEMNMTMIRCWHGNNDFKSFYEACDRYGILVYDDFWTHGSRFGLVPDDVPMIKRNATDKIKRLRNHASLAIWCGENEAVPPTEINNHLAQQIAALDGTRIYIEASNEFPVHGGVTYAVQAPDWFYDHASGFTTEIGSPAIPPVESMRAMMAEVDLWPVGNSVWAYHDWDADIGNKNLPAYEAAIDDRYGTATDIDDFCRKAQLLNYETFRALFEAWNANMWDDCGGALLWMSKQTWPSTIWQTFDHFFEPGGAYFGCKKACEPVHVQWNYGDGLVRVINNTAVPLSQVSAQVEVYNLDGSLQYQTNFSGLNIPVNSPAICGEVLALGGTHVALGRPAMASSVYNNGGNVAANAFDGDEGTRWESNWGSQPEWLQVDLGEPKAIDTVILYWEGAYGSGYQIQVSDNASSWQTVYSTTTGNGGQDVISFPTVTNRYVRMYGTQLGTIWGFSLWEMEVYEADTLLEGLSSVHFVKLKLEDSNGNLLSRNLYWRGTTTLAYEDLDTAALVTPRMRTTSVSDGVTTRVGVSVENAPGGMLISGRLKLVRDSSGERVLPAYYEDNYFFLTPGETNVVPIEFANVDLEGEQPRLVLEGWNMNPIEVAVEGSVDLGELSWAPTGPGGLTLAWDAVPTQRYCVQVATDAATGPWLDHGAPFEASNLREEVEVPVDTASAKFYRVKAVF